MNADSKKVVAAGYDRMAERYLHWTAASSVRQHWLDVISAMLAPHARVLDLGCGAGVSVARHLAMHGCRVVGVDGSQQQIMLARQNEPRGTFIVADMASVDFEPMSFDAVTAFYSITHVPRVEHRALLARIRTWLKPGGLFLASMGFHDSPDWTGEWLGVTMFFSHFDADTNRALVEDTGFLVERADIIAEDEDGEVVRFLWILARRASETSSVGPDS